MTLRQRLLPLFLLLSGCGVKAPEPPEPGGTAAEAAAFILSGQDAVPMDLIPFGSGDFSEYASLFYGLDPEKLADGFICCARGMSARELAVLAFAGEDEAAAARTALEAYRDSRAADFEGYVPDQAALAEAGRVEVRGRWAALLLLPDPAAAAEAFTACFAPDWTPPDPEAVFAALSGPEPEHEPEYKPDPAEQPDPEREHEPEQPEPEPDPEPAPEPLPPEPDPEPGTEPAPAPVTPPPLPAPPSPPPTPDLPPEPEPVPEDPYDHDAVVNAWRSGDPSGLSEKNRAIYDACREALAMAVTPDMEDWQKELAVHDYMLLWGKYDPEASSHASGAAPDPDNDNPYGFLVHGVGICRGYTSTFQLFMDLLGIECITVPGKTAKGLEHAWNMVRLDGNWYFVDVTWDDPTNAAPGHWYFNATGDYLRQHSHIWDESAYPEAAEEFRIPAE